jgi:hypothetical protein
VDQETLRGQVSEYRIYESIASGGFGSVFIGRDTTTNVPVAVKRLHPHLRSEPGFVERFEQEASTVRGLVHPNIVRLLDQGRDLSGVPFIVMEWVEGLTIGDWLKRRGRYGTSEAADVGCQVLEGLDAAWERRVVHRDIKPANLMVTPSGRVKIMDFGVAKDVDLATLAGSSGLIGTPAYMAPEQLRGQPLDCRADLYALGVTLYLMVAGRPPFEGPSFADYFRQHLEQQPPPLQDFSPDVDPGLAAVLLRALAKLPEERFANPAEMLTNLQQFTVEKTRPVTPPVTPPDVERTVVSRHTPQTQAAVAVATPMPEASPATVMARPTPEPAGATVAVRPKGASRAQVGVRRPVAPWMIAGPAALEVLVVAAGVLFLASQRVGPQPDQGGAPTTTPANEATVGAQATVAVQATATASGVLFSDPLDDLLKAKLPRSSGASASNYQVGYASDGYNITKVNPSYAPVAAVPIPGSFDDTVLAVDARVIDAADNRFAALGCRDQGSASGGYQLRVFPSSGQAQLMRIEGGIATVLEGPVNVDSINRGDAVNHVELLCVGPSISGRINGADVAPVQDTLYTNGALSIGAGANAGGTQTVEAHFKNLVATRP